MLEVRDRTRAAIRQTSDAMDDDGDSNAELQALFTQLKALLDEIDGRITRQATTPRSALITTVVNANCVLLPPIARSLAAFAPSGVQTCSQPFAPSSAPPRVAVSTPIRLSGWHHKANPSSHRVEQIRARRPNPSFLLVARVSF